MQGIVDLILPLLVLRAIVAAGLSFLCRTLARRFPEERFLGYWAWAWAAYAAYLVFGLPGAELPKHVLLSEALIFVAMAAGYSQPALLVLGAEALRKRVLPARRQRSWVITTTIAIGVLVFFLARLSTDSLAVRIAPRQALVGFAFFYCAAAFKMRARRKASRSASVVTTACAGYGIVLLLLAVASVLTVHKPQLHSIAFLICLDLVCQFAVAAGIILQLDEEYQLQQRRLGESEDRFLVLFENNPLPIFVYDVEQFRFLAVNQAAIKHYGYSRGEFLAMSVLDIRPEEYRAAALSALRGKRMRPIGAMGTWRHRKKDGTVFDADIVTKETRFRGRPARMAVAIDVSERARLEEQLRQAQKMEAVGQLAGGVAHDFNNLLTVIRGQVEVLGRNAGLREPQKNHLDQIDQAAERASALIRQLLAFSRKQVLQPKVLQFDAVVTEMAEMLRRLVGEHIELAIESDPQLGRVKADRSQMEQVLVNLALNARDAMPSGGRLTIRTSSVEIAQDSSSLGSGTELTAGRYVLLEVADTGAGMDRATRARVFEPFFTTKDLGQGTGLGLATAYGIVKQSGGWIGLESEPARGTTFKVFLPQVEASVDPTGIEERAALPSPSGVGHETILLVEDEERIRDLAGKFLTSRGYTVLAAGNGAEALDLVQHHASPVDLLVTDMIMPKLDGKELVRQLARCVPQMKVLYISGYSNRSGVEIAIDESASYLPKPFSMEQLVRKVREVLGRPS